jgi:hypothetical protein
MRALLPAETLRSVLGFALQRKEINDRISSEIIVT